MFCQGKEFYKFFFFEVKKISQDLLEGKILQVFVVEKNFASVSPKRKKSFASLLSRRENFISLLSRSLVKSDSYKRVLGVVVRVI